MKQKELKEIEAKGIADEYSQKDKEIAAIEAKEMMEPYTTKDKQKELEVNEA